MKTDQQRRPWRTKRHDLDSVEHTKLVDELLEYLDYAADAKREVEKEAQYAWQHMCSYLNERSHPWPSKVYDPIVYSTQTSKLAKWADAIFSSPPIFDYQPGGWSPPQAAQSLTATVSYHLREIRPRQPLLTALTERSLAGTVVLTSWWDYREQVCEYWKRVPRQSSYLDPMTGQPVNYWVEDGKWAYHRAKKIVRDSPNFRPLHITQVYIDDTQPNFEDDGLFVAVRDMVDAEEARQRVKTQGWDPKAVERALEGDLPEGRLRGINNTLDWLQQIGLRNDTERAWLNRRDGRKAVEAIEFWMRRGPRIRRYVILNRAWLAFDGPSPFAMAGFPFVVSRNFPMLGHFWGLSDYRVVRYLLRGIQSLRNAEVSEAMLGAMPPLLMPQSGMITGQRWEPRAVWHYDGMTVEQMQFLERSGQSIRIAQGSADALLGRMDLALGTSDPARGGVSQQSGRQKATALSMAFEAAGLRDKFSVDNLSDDTLIPLAAQFRDLVQQFQEYPVQEALVPGSDPVTIWPEDYRDADLYSIPTPATSALKAQKERRMLDLYNLVQQSQEPHAERRNLFELVLETIAPSEKEKILKPLEQVQAEMQQAMGGMGQVQMAPPGQAAAGYQSPFPAGGPGVDELAGELGEAYAA